MNNKKQFGLFLLLFFLCICSFSSTKYDYKYFKKNKDEGMHYIIKLKDLYDLLCERPKCLEKFSLEQSKQEYIAVEEMCLDKVKKNGYVATKLKEAEKRGLFKLLILAYNAPKQNSLSIWNLKIDRDTLIFCILKIRRILRYRIFTNAQQKKWDLVTNDLKIWLNIGVLSKEYLWSKPVLISIFNLFQKYDMPLKTIQQIVSLNKLIVADPPDDYKQQAVDMSIINIIVGNLLIYEKLNSTLPDTLSQIKSLESLLKKMSIDIKYRKIGKSWSLQYKSEIINKGKQLYPFKISYTSRQSQTNRDTGVKP